MTYTMIIGLLAVLLCGIGLAVLAVTRRRGGLTLSNITEGRSWTGKKTYLNDAAVTGRYRVGKLGSDAAHVALCTATTDISIGVIEDETATSSGWPLEVALHGQGGGTRLVLLNGTVAAGDELVPDATGAAVKLPATTGTYYPFGRALMAGVAGDQIECTSMAPIARVIP